MGKLKSIGIIGAGIMGIDIARQLNKEGYNVTILEGAPAIGGLAVSSHFGQYIWDKFYHVILPDDTFTINMMKELGLEDELIWNETKTGFYINDRYYSISDTIEFIKFPALNIFEKMRLAITILLGSFLKDYKRLETIPVKDWLIRWSGRNTFNKIWLPLLKSKFGEEYKYTSAAFICATIKRLYGARKKGVKKETFGYVKGGYSIVLEALKTKLLNEEISLVSNFKIDKITRSINNELKVTSIEGKEINFDYVICTLPSALTASICHELTDIEKDRLSGIKYLGVLCVSLLIKKPLTPYYVTNISDNKIPFTGVIEMTSLVDRSFFGGNSLVYLPKYLKSDDQLFSLSDQTLKENFINSLKIMQPMLMENDIIDSQVARAKYVISLPEIGYSGKLPSFQTSIQNLFIINSSFITDGTLNINETLKVSRNYLPKVLRIIKNEE